MLRFVLTAIMTAAPAIGSASTLFANCTFSKSVSAEVSFKGGAVTFTEQDKSLNVMIADEMLEDNRALWAQPHYTANLSVTIGPFALSYSEEHYAGTISVTTIYMDSAMPSGKYAAAHIRTFNADAPKSPIRSAVTSLWVGSCRVERGQ